MPQDEQNEASADALGPGYRATERDVRRWVFDRQRRWIAGAMVFTALHQTAEAAVPVMVGAVVDHAIDGGGPADLLRWIALLALLFLALSTAMRLAGRCNRHASQDAAHELRVAAVTRILDPRGFAAQAGSSGTLLSTATADALRIGLGNRAWAIGAGAAAALAFGATALLLTSVQLGLVVLVGLVPLLAATRLLAAPLTARSSAEQAEVARATGTAADLVRGLRVVKGLGAEEAALRRYRVASGSSLAATVRAARWEAGYQGLTLLLNGCFLTVVAWSGARLAVDGSISVGEFVASVGLAQFLVGPSTRFGMAMGLRAKARGSAARMAALLAEPYAVAGGPRTAAGRPDGALVLAGLGAGPLRHLDLTVRPGTTVGVVTPDPAVAAALLDVLALRRPAERGQVELDGVPLAELSLAEARRVLLVADHEADLFDLTVAENVRGPLDAPADPALVARAMSAADADQVLSVLPDGGRSRIGERGRILSGGQRQRVALARALAADPAVLVLHEPTTAVDAATEADIADGLRAMRADRTTLLVTTSPILLQTCDRVVFLDDGVPTATGTHRELTIDQPSYRTAVMA
ncbi:ABC transporter ATP-binding protein [Kitasatospora sp. NPDC096077]|uniref:ABC transporter ATP-binding protein n=1 Tax=Kitasatospora sp. NPDC096077 TaxID=3155544 RepID=UPI00331D5C98